MRYQDLVNEPKDRMAVGEDTNFLAGDSPAIIDIQDQLGTHSVDGTILCPSQTSGILIEISTDGSTYQPQFTVFPEELFPLVGYKIKKIRVTHNGGNSAYRIVAR